MQRMTGRCNLNDSEEFMQFVFRLFGYLLFEGACFRIFCHYIMQCFNADVDDATELVLDHTDNTQTT